jgi:hypothetical protein
MALDTSTLISAIEQAFLDQRDNTNDPDSAAQDLANKIGAALENWVKTLQITYSSGLVDPGGSVTGTFIYTLS